MVLNCCESSWSSLAQECSSDLMGKVINFFLIPLRFFLSCKECIAICPRATSFVNFIIDVKFAFGLLIDCEESISCVRAHNEAQHQQFLSITSLATGDPPAKNSRAHALINNKFVRRETRLEEHKFHSNSFQWAAAVGSINRDSFDVEVGLSLPAFDDRVFRARAWSEFTMKEEGREL